MANILPYMRQLPQDYYAKNYVPPAPVIVSPPVLTPTPPTPPPEDIPTSPSSGGVWYGTSPPSNVEIGLMWLNPANNGLYVFTDPGVWTHTGTNW